MAKSSVFYPPLLNPLFVRLCQSVIPIIGYWQYRMTLEISKNDLEKLAALGDYRMLLLSNHPSYHDWIAIFLLSARLGNVFYYLAASERFKGKSARFLQMLGAYSIRRGLADRASVAQTLQLLMQPQCQMVVFPEGGCSFQNDTVMPFRVGAVQMAFQAMNKLVKQGEAVPDLYTVPVSLKYRYTGDMNQVIDQTLSQLETALQIQAITSPSSMIPSDKKGGMDSQVQFGQNFYPRLRAIAEKVLVSFEQDYGLYTDEIAQQNWNDRIIQLKSHIIQSCEQKLGLISAPGEAIRERVYKIQNVLESRAESLGKDDFWTYESLHKAAARLLNFDAIYDGYVAANPTSERFLETLFRLEREVFGIRQPIPKGDRKVIIKIGEPVNLKNYFENYQQDKSGTVNLLIKNLQENVQNLLLV
ncbi:MAG TPA: 1-acyl-sn-glycerol-3-phosphate acyltransferase [Oculatellaceae cyanobacterium]